jgi:hypothetical protein
MCRNCNNLIGPLDVLPPDEVYLRRQKKILVVTATRVGEWGLELAGSPQGDTVLAALDLLLLAIFVLCSVELLRPFSTVQGTSSFGGGKRHN